ncbi:hypothetical protein [Actinomycetospora termitidis]|uniref:Holin n=1 Tax=Actinomycetospora termitidis TaxID=3053470 RepID=A0ABT7MFF2_9PSEU|nr:hypothetical protein [Actinomycetospora sp. Odt1-22]MDL5159393.1 hypothetical protein [Actinomycetospora sp. Odt1-22]
MKLARDVAMLLGGLGLSFYETVISPEPREVILALAALMLGLPASLISDRAFVKLTGKLGPQEPPPEDDEKTDELAKP